MRDIQQEITTAIDHAYSQQEVEAFEAKRNELKVQFLTDKLTFRQFKQEAYELEETVLQVAFDTPEALKEGLIIAGLSEEEANLQVELQLRQNRRLIQFGLPLRFSVLFYYTHARSLKAILSTQINLFSNKAEQQLRNGIFTLAS